MCGVGGRRARDRVRGTARLGKNGHRPAIWLAARGARGGVVVGGAREDRRQRGRLRTSRRNRHERGAGRFGFRVGGGQIEGGGAGSRGARGRLGCIVFVFIHVEHGSQPPLLATPPPPRNT